MATKTLANIAVVVAIISGIIGITVGIPIATASESWDPIGFVNPALIEYEDGTVPTIEGIDGPALYIGAEGEPVLPLMWIEFNQESFPVETVFTSEVISWYDGSSILTHPEGTKRSDFKPGINTYHSMIPIDPGVRAEIRSLAQKGICQSTWQIVAQTTPVKIDGRETSPIEFFSENYTLVTDDCYE